MTHPSDIAGLSERLREMPSSLNDACRKMDEAATALDSLSARVKELEAFTKELSDALLTIRPLGGSECFVKRCDAYYADPDYFKGFIKCEADSRRESMKDLTRERKDRIRAEQQRDEAYHAAETIITSWWAENHPPVMKRNIELERAIAEILAAIRRLASGPESAAKPQESKP